jgi:uncharacterized membrane protein YgcG
MLKQYVLKQQHITTFLGLLIAAWTLLVAIPPVSAQLQPSISPWMGMFDRSPSSGGISNNYLRNVRPQQEMMRSYAAQANQLQAQQQALRALQNSGGGGGSAGGTGSRDLMGAAAGGGGSSGAGGNTLLSPPREIPRAQRNPAGFNQYLHYYPSGSLPRQPVPNFSSAGRR